MLEELLGLRELVQGFIHNRRLGPHSAALRDVPRFQVGDDDRDEIGKLDDNIDDLETDTCIYV